MKASLIKMSNVYGYAQALSEGQSYSARTMEHNDLVSQYNDKVKTDYGLAVKAQLKDKSDDKSRLEADSAISGTEDGKGLLSAGVGTYGLVKATSEAGTLGGAIAAQSAARQATIAKTFSKLGQGEKIVPTQSIELGTAKADGSFVTEAGEDAGSIAADAASGAGKAGEEIGSSGVGAALIKGGLKMGGAGKVLGEAGLSTVSEIGGKAAGEFGGIVSLGEGIDNLANKKSFFAGDDTAEKWGDSFQMAGAGLDVIGTAFPPLEILGGAVGLLGGIIDTFDSISKDEKRKQSDSAPVVKPPMETMKVSPAYQSLGLVASAPVSAKMSITGSSGAF